MFLKNGKYSLRFKVTWSADIIKTVTRRWIKVFRIKRKYDCNDLVSCISDTRNCQLMVPFHKTLANSFHWSTLNSQNNDPSFFSFILLIMKLGCSVSYIIHHEFLQCTYVIKNQCWRFVRCCFTFLLLWLLCRNREIYCISSPLVRSIEIQLPTFLEDFSKHLLKWSFYFVLQNTHVESQNYCRQMRK